VVWSEQKYSRIGFSDEGRSSQFFFTALFALQTINKLQWVLELKLINCYIFSKISANSLLGGVYWDTQELFRKNIGILSKIKGFILRHRVAMQ
jgi:hypothetical protein